MKFFDYLDIIYVKKNLDLQVKFQLKTQAETRAITDLINYQRQYFKFIGAIAIVFDFIKCKITGKYPEMPDIKKPAPEKVEASDVQAQTPT